MTKIYKPEFESQVLKLDIGCGKNKKPGYIGIDQYKMDGVDIILDVGKDKLPFEDGTVVEIHSSHFLEHLTSKERCHFLNEAHRVLKKGKYDNGVLIEGFAVIATPYCFSTRAYGDPTHQWPPIGEFFYYYLSKEWRDANAPHSDKKFNPEGYDCDFNTVNFNYTIPGHLVGRNDEYKYMVMSTQIEGKQDMIVTMIKK